MVARDVVASSILRGATNIESVVQNLRYRAIISVGHWVIYESPCAAQRPRSRAIRTPAYFRNQTPESAAA
jgi:hypothetical protein